MPRAVLYDSRSRAAVRAVGLLEDSYDVNPLGPGATPPRGAVIVAGTDAPLPASSRQWRIVALLAGGAEPPAGACYAVLPAAPPRAVLLRAIANALADLEAWAEIAKLRGELRELNAIGISLSSERDPVALLDLILTKARAITASDGGSLYLVQERPDGGRELHFALTQNDSVTFSFRATTLPLDSDSIAGHVALTRERVNLPDAYYLPAGAPFSINRSFDEQTGYRTKSMLVVPMLTPQRETLGVLQLINCKPLHRGRLRGPEDVARHVLPFSPRFEGLAESLASQAAVALQNSRLYEEIRHLFEGFVAAAVTAIESRDPTTSGHSFRVAELTTGLAEAADRCRQGVYASLRFTADELRELRYAALLHDFGKVGVREHVLLKAKKLYPGDLERIRQRIALLKQGAELKHARARLDDLLAKGRRGFERRTARLDAELRRVLDELDASLASIVVANEPTVLPRDIARRIDELARRRFGDESEPEQAILTTAEARVLAIPRGSLTGDEIGEIRSHVRHSWEFLAQIPWTREFRRVPEIARSHHEKLDGSGYPYGAKGDEIPVQSRIVTIADIYDALTAADRPYKSAVPVERALDILDAERRAGTIDPALVDLFIDARVFERTQRRP
jgi:HD-GYP domain-containing protein (c-di-GMP phosphodiesterase class II)